ncbi:hypothetical protein A9G43_08585, partial [Gilliamella sp. Occ3-1]|uniref:CDP-glycerol glycerophosphotransferase family protein n=1 Tax=Gilliamella sp. Occ3-1 TaxID=3120253 RepID=UPI00080DD55E
MSIDKKWKKFKRNPKIFFSDMYQKRKNNILKYTPKRRYKTEQVFTVISAVYGVEKYLNDYFKSLVNQTIGFKSHIHLILVDDDSPDNSAKIIHEWVEKYPDNITYIHKENGGQASARNLGMDFAKTKWVSFIDPDDFICLDYFEEIAKTIDNNPNLGIINCNLVFFYEKSRQYSDTHALKYKFQNGVIYTSGSNLEKNIIMSASSSVFDLKIIINNGLLFHKKVKPTFEDARFISEYLFYMQSLQAAFIPNAKYYYRKRADESSTIDKSWQDTRKYLDIFEYGYIFILEFYHNKMQGKVPEFIQRQVLYDLSWYCKYLLNNPSPLEILDEEQKKKFHQNVKKTFRYINRKVILEFELAGIWLFFKIGMLGAFKNDDSFKQTAYIERFDQAKQEILISYNSFEDSVISVMFDGEDTIPRYIKQKRHTFAAEYFVTTNKMWIKLPDHFNNFQIIINGILSRISLSGQVFNKLTRESLFTHLKKLLPENQDEHWILMDRDIQADDNAEHLYRYINKKHPEQKIYYVLSKDSHDWNRLKADNFKLLDFNSAQHKFLLKRASKIISSHAEKHIHNFFSDNSMIKQQFVFLQHGVISQDLSTWLNGKPNIDLMITSTKAEKDSITFNQQYYLTAKEVVLTGLARHDSLFFKHKKFSSNDKIILIMPTWRNYILPATKLGQFKRDINSNFMLTQYAIYWQSFLKNSRLKEISNKNIKIIFAPHKNIEPYLDNFELPAYIETWKSQEESIQNLFLKSSLLVTDYSSVAFDMAFLEKQVIYYQFDEDEFYSGKHTYTKGYFDFRKDGFGPVVTKENELIEAIDKIVRNGFIIEQPYISRIKNLYPFRDGKCCERIFQAIKNLDKPSTNKFVDLEILKRFMLMSSYHRDWNSAIERSKRILLLGDNKHKNIAYQILAEASYHQYQPSIFFDNADINFEQIKDNKTKALILMACEKWEEAYSYWDIAINKQEIDYYYQLMCYQHIYHQGHKLAINISDLEKLTENKSVLYLFKALIYNSQQNLEDAIKQLNLCLTYNTSSLFLKRYQPQLLLADIYRRIGELAKCHSQLIDFEKHTRNNTQCRIQIAKLALK